MMALLIVQVCQIYQLEAIVELQVLVATEQVV